MTFSLWYGFGTRNLIAVGEARQRLLEAALANIAPRANDI